VIMSAYKLESVALLVLGIVLAVVVGIHVMSAVSGALQKATAGFEQATQGKPAAR
jgi:cytochrome c biogenesis protein CcdA